MCASIMLAAGGTLIDAPVATAQPGTVQYRLADPGAAEVGELVEIEVVVRNAEAVAAFEIAATVDGQRAELVGADSRPLGGAAATFEDLSISDLEDRAVLAAFTPGAGASRPSTYSVGRFYFKATEPGRFQIRVGQAHFADSAGSPLAQRGADQIVVAVGDVAPGAPVIAAPAVPGRGSKPADKVSAAPLPGAVDEVRLDWQSGRLAGGSCMAAAGATPCVSVADLQRLAAEATVMTAESSTSTVAQADAPFVVNSTGDQSDANQGNGTCATSTGVCTLRAAIQESNARTGPNTVHFNIAGPTPHVIQLSSRLPAFFDTTGPTTVDGYTQPGSSANTDPLISNAVIGIEIKGTGPTTFDAVALTTGGNTLRGLSIYNAKRPILISGTGVGAAGNVIIGNFIGTDSTGTFGYTDPALVGHGIHVEQDSPNTRIGGVALADRNVISGNGRHGIGMWHSHSDYSVVYNNIIGLSPDGTRALPNLRHGVDMNFGSSGNTVGGTSTGMRNVMSANGEDGIEVSHTTDTRDNRIIGNFVGTTVDGLSAPAYTANVRAGIYIEDAATNNLVEGNVVGNNRTGGIRVLNGGVNGVSTGNIVRGNWVGITQTGVAIPNGQVGISVDGADGVIGPGNVIAWNNGPGIQVVELDSTRNRITQNVVRNNTGLSIDLSPVGSVNPNDPSDGDSGPNGLLNRPEFIRATTQVFEGTACAGCVVEFFLSSGAGPGPLLQYLWSATADGTGRFSSPNTTSGEGTVVTATATDPSGNTSEVSANATVVVHNDPPVVDAGADAVVLEGGTVGLTATGTDPDGDPVTYDWDLDGDGTFETPGASVTFSAAALDGPAAPTPTVRGTDSKGASSTDTTTVNVGNVAPTATFAVSATTKDEGETFQLSLSLPADPSSADLAALRYGFNCNGTDLSTVTYADASASPNMVCLASDGPATRSVAGVVLDDDLGRTEYSGTIDLVNLPPTVDITGLATSVNEGATITADMTIADPSAVDQTAGFTTSWTATRAGSEVASGTTPSISFVATDNGDLQLTATATDKDAGQGSDTGTVAVTNVAPTADFVTSFVVVDSITTVTLELTNQVEPSQDDVTAGLRYAFSCTGASLSAVTYQTASTSSTRQCIYSSGSSFPVRAKILDKDGGSSTYATTVSTGSNLPPSVSTSSVSLAEGSSVTLDAEGSDPEGGELTYSWDFDGDGTYETAGRNPQFSAALIDGPASREISVKATDPEGAEAVAYATVTVNNAAPTAVLPTLSAQEGTEVVVSLGSIADPSPSDQASLRFAFSCTGSSLSGIDYSSASTQSSVTCLYPNGPLSTSFRAKVFDDDGASTELVGTMTVANVAPSVSITPSQAGYTEGETATATIEATDVPADTSSGFVISWTVTRAGATVASGSGASVSFSAADNGPYTINAAATDVDGGEGTATVAVPVAGVAPTATPQVPAAATEGSSIPVQLVDPVDPSPADVSAGLRIAVHCTGGSLAGSTWSTSTPGLSTSCTAIDGPATQTVRMRIYDDDDQYTEYTRDVTVSNVAPTAAFIVPIAITEADVLPLGVEQISDPAVADVAGLRFRFDCGAGYGPETTATTSSCAGLAVGPRTVGLRVIDDDGGTTEYTAMAVVHDNRLQNPSLETDANGDGRPDNWTGGSTIQWVSGSAHTGSRSLASSATGTTSGTTVSQTVTTLPPRNTVVSAWVDVPATTNSVRFQLRINWLNSTGGTITTGTAPAVTSPTGGWVLVEKEMTRPASATQARVDLIWTTTNAVVRVDDIALRASNDLLNNGFEIDANGDQRPDSWSSLSRFTKDNIIVYRGTWSGAARGDGSKFTISQKIARVTPGVTYHISARVNAPTTSAPVSMTARIRFRTAAGATISVVNIAVVSDDTPGWVNLRGSVVAPSNTNDASVELWVSNLTTNMYFDEVLFAPT